MENIARIAKALREHGPATYGELQELSRVPAGSFGRVLGAMTEDGTLVRIDGRYHLADGAYYHPAIEGDTGDSASGEGVPAAEAEAEESRTRSGTWAYCAKCGLSHPHLTTAEKISGKRYEHYHAAP